MAGPVQLTPAYSPRPHHHPARPPRSHPPALAPHSSRGSSFFFIYHLIINFTPTFAPLTFSFYSLEYVYIILTIFVSFTYLKFLSKKSR